MKFRLFVFLILLGGATAFAQVPEDALRFATPVLGIGPRAVGMGSAFLPIADDYTALYWNPAGLGQLGRREVSFGLSNAGYTSDASFQSLTTTSFINSLQLDNIGVVIPARHNTAGFAFAFGYNKVNDFTSATSFSGVNPNSTLIEWQVRNTAFSPTTSIVYLAGVAGIVKGTLTTPVKSGLRQAGTVEEGGSLHALSIGGGGEIAEGLDLGASLHIYTGSYTYGRQYKETDVNGLYTAQDTANWTNIDLYQYAQNDNVDASIGGFGATVGLLYHFADVASMGVTIDVPSSYHITENFSTVAQSSFDNGDLSGKITENFRNEYDVTTPLTLGAGVAGHPIPLLTISGAIDYRDYTQLRFSNTSDQTLMQYNTDMRTIFRPTYNYRLGVEYKIAPLGLGVRAGYQFFESAYAADPSGEGQKTISGGVSMVLAKKALLEVAYAHGTMKAVHVNYDATSMTNETISLNHFLLGFAYRF